MIKNRSGTVVNCLYRILNAGILTCFIVFAIGNLWGIKEPSFRHLVVVLLIIIAMTGINYLELRGRAILICAIVGGLLIAVMVTGMSESLLFAQNYLNWLTNGSSWNEEWIKFYEVIQAGIIAVLGYILEAVIERYSLLRKVSGALVLLWLMIQLFSREAVSHICVMFAICYLLIVYIEIIQNSWKKTKSGGIKDYVLWIMPFVMAFTILIGFTPAPENPYDWKFVKEAYRRISDRLTIFSQNFLQADGEGFGMTMSGFSEEGALQGGIFDSDNEAMRIKGQSSLMTNVYLVGKVFDAFDGREWKLENESSEEDRLMDTIETLYAIERYGGDHFRNYVYSTSLHVEYRYIKTGYLFAPLKSVTFFDRSNKTTYSNVGGNLVLDKRRGYGTSYDVQFYQMNVDHPEFYRFLEAEIPEDEKIWDSIRKKYKHKNKDSIKKNELELHRQEVRDNYLYDIEPSDEVKSYLDEITEGAETDVEKLKAIERALSGFTYKKDIGELPAGIHSAEEFLDYFLLESKEGYCTYFATAFVLLAWEEGIPARYVQGYCIPVQKNKERDVKSSMAHAWPEVYIDGVGWIPFEPTPGYDSIRYTPWEMKESTDSEASLVAGAGTGKHYWEEDNIPEQTPEQLELQELSETRSKSGEMIGTILLYTFLLVLAVCLIMLIVDGVVGRVRYKRLNLVEQYRFQVNKSLHILAIIGYKRRSYETLHEFSKRAIYALDDDISQRAISFIEYYEELLYGRREGEESLLSDIAESQKLLLKELKKQKNRAYPIYRIKLYLNRKSML